MHTRTAAHRAGRDGEPHGDLGVREAGAEENDDLPLARRQRAEASGEQLDGGPVPGLPQRVAGTEVRAQCIEVGAVALGEVPTARPREEEDLRVRQRVEPEREPALEVLRAELLRADPAPTQLRQGHDIRAVRAEGAGRLVPTADGVRLRRQFLVRASPDGDDATRARVRAGGRSRRRRRRRTARGGGARRGTQPENGSSSNSISAVSTTNRPTRRSSRSRRVCAPLVTEDTTNIT